MRDDGEEEFSEGRVAYLRSLRAVARVSHGRIRYTEEFKRDVMRRYRAGESPARIFAQAGLPSSLIGYKRIERCIYRWKDIPSLNEGGDVAGVGSGSGSGSTGVGSSSGLDVTGAGTGADGAGAVAGNAGSGDAGVAGAGAGIDAGADVVDGDAGASVGFAAGTGSGVGGGVGAGYGAGPRGGFGANGVAGIFREPGSWAAGEDDEPDSGPTVARGGYGYGYGAGSRGYGYGAGARGVYDAYGDGDAWGDADAPRLSTDVESEGRDLRDILIAQQVARIDELEQEISRLREILASLGGVRSEGDGEA